MLFRPLLAFSVLLFSVLLATAPMLSAATFERDVRPILKEHCFHCHGEAGVKEAELDLRLRRWLVAGGDSGAAIDLTQPDQSLLLERVESGDMPPGDKNLSDEELQVLREWIRQGAKTARPEPESLDNGDYITEEERRFWAFQPVDHPQPPIASGDKIRNPIDAFIWDQLKHRGLRFSPPADRYTLIRRASFDLLGLPPDPESIDRFVHDKRPGAFERLIERLLASPRYGERWGRHWLDVAGYADSDGYSDRDTVREFAYFYRDYVIDSFNANKPLDRFIREQLAGDEMSGSDASRNEASLTQERIEPLAATGFLRMAPDGTTDGSVDRALAANETIAATLEIVSTSLLGLTVGCARCHDHRYDPISQADYYRFRAIFEPALDSKQWRRPNQRRISLYTEQDRKTRDQIERKAKELTDARTDRQKEHIDRTLEEELLVVPDDVRDALRTAYRTPKNDRSQEQMELLLTYPSVGNISAGSLYLYAQQRGRRANDIERVANEREATYVRQLREQRIAQQPASVQPSLTALLDDDANNRSSQQQELAETHSDVFVEAADLKKLWPDKFEEIQHYRQAAAICRKLDAKTELAEMQKEIAAVRAQAPKERFLRVLDEPPHHLPPTHLFVRGDHNQPSKELPPAELTVLQSWSPAPIASDNPELPTSGRRLAYAKHLTSGEHPLLARVLVNRVWMHHFGRGIVATPGDFGRLGQRPTHPKLLDWLASELVRSGWDLKHLHRLIMSSQTYRQQSTRSEELDRIDPDNKLYARMSVRRLESEAIRDAVLKVSGSLVHRMHGPPVPVKEDSVGQIVLGVEMLDGERKPTGEQQSFEGAARRSVYVQVRRTRPLAILETFDIAANSPNCTLRSYSNVAPQSLMLMNSQFAIEHAEKLAGELMDGCENGSQRLTEAWRRCFGRPIRQEELSQMSEFLALQSNAFRQQDASLTQKQADHLALASACQAILGSSEFLYID